jgi:transposase-like protein
MAKRGGKRHSPEQIVQKLRDGDAMLNAGKSVAEVVQHLGVSEQTYYRWKNQYGGMKSEEAKRLKELEIENAKLKKLLAEAELDKAMLKEIASGNW